jgi:hypothetical protein
MGAWTDREEEERYTGQESEACTPRSSAGCHIEYQVQQGSGSSIESGGMSRSRRDEREVEHKHTDRILSRRERGKKETALIKYENTETRRQRQTTCTFAWARNESKRVTLVVVHVPLEVANSCQLLPNEAARVKTSLPVPPGSQLTTTQTHSQPHSPSRSLVHNKSPSLFRHATSTSLGIPPIPRL